MMDKDMDILYQPYYCEENIWHLCQHKYLSEGINYVVFISNPQLNVMFWSQRIAKESQSPIIWDYHVVLFHKGHQDECWWVWDLDTLIGYPAKFEHYIQNSFSMIDQAHVRYHPVFRVIDAADYVANFSSDRSHMFNTQSCYVHDPPPWPPIGIADQPHNLHRFIDMQEPYLGDLYNLAEIIERFSVIEH
jgi:hypothetical protein